MTRKTSNAAVRVRRNRKTGSDGPVQLSTGYWAIIRPVAASLLADAQALIKDPEVPETWIEEKQRSEPNPSHPAYVRAMEEAQAERILASIDTLVLFGVEVIDPDTGNTITVPEDDRWLKKLHLLARTGRLDLSQFNLEDDFDLEFLFKKYVVVSAQDIGTISAATGLTEEDITAARNTFRDNS